MEADIPGVKKQDIQLTVDNDVLTIAVAEEEEGESSEGQPQQATMQEVRAHKLAQSGQAQNV